MNPNTGGVTISEFKNLADLLSIGRIKRRDFLVRTAALGMASAILAELWESDASAKNWTLQLRRDVEFHNGKAMFAADVVYSINHHRGENTKSPAKSILAPIKTIKPDGKHAVVFELES